MNMTERAEEIVGLIRNVIAKTERAAFEADAEPIGVQAARESWRGHDNGIVFGTFTEALENLLESNIMPTGCNSFDPDDWDEDGDSARAAHLIRALATSYPATIGTGDPLAYVGVDGFFTLIRSEASSPEIERITLDCIEPEEAD